MSAGRVRAWLLAAALCLGAPAQAHRFHVALTDIGFNPKTGSTEIVHTYMAHDVEAMLAQLYQREFDLSQAEDEAILRKYVEKRFYVLAPDNTRLPLRWVGLALGVESITLYQEIENAPLANSARIHNEVLIDFIADQVNTINLNEAGTTRSLRFTKSNLEQSVR
jgi:hypothetical protein